MIPGALINMRIVDECDNSIDSKNICVPSNASVRPSCGEYVCTSDGKKRYLVVRDEWCKLFKEKDMMGFKLVLRDVSDTLTDEEKAKEK